MFKGHGFVHSSSPRGFCLVTAVCVLLALLLHEGPRPPALLPPASQNLARTRTRPRPPLPSPDEEHVQEKVRKTRRGPAVSLETYALVAELRGLRAGSSEAKARAQQILETGYTKLQRTKEFSAIMGAFGRLQLWQESLALLAIRQSQRPDLEATNAAMIACSSSAERWPVVLHMLGNLWNESAPPGMSTYNIVMAACSRAGEWQKVLELHSEMLKIRRRDLYTFNVSLHACVQGRVWEQGLSLLDEMLYSGVTPRWEMYNLGIMLAGEGLKWKIALGFLENMWKREVIPDEVTYSAVIDACERSGRWQEAVDLLGIMKRKGYEVKAETVRAVLRTCETSNQEGAIKILKEDLQFRYPR